MLLAIDIGNTAIHFGVWQGERVLRQARVPSALPRWQLAAKVRRCLRRLPVRKADCAGIVICCVVPKVLRLVEAVVQRELGCDVLVVGRDMNVPLANHYRQPRQVGQDRLVGAFAAKKLYGAPLIIVDLGTAITVDVVSRQGVYQGGMIIPGVQLSAEVLAQRTALLPLVKIRRPAGLVGRSTRDSILSGLFFGYGEMLKGLIKVLSRQLKGRVRVVMTGGCSGLMKEYTQGRQWRLEPDLVLKGLRMLWDFEKTSRRQGRRAKRAS